MASNFFPKRQWYLTPLLLLLLILVCGLQSCSKGSPQEPKSSGLAGSLWTEGTGTMLLDLRQRQRSALHPHALGEPLAR